MIYSMEIYVRESEDVSAVSVKPIMIRTHAYTKDTVLDEEIDAVVEFFKSQVQNILYVIMRG